MRYKIFTVTGSIWFIDLENKIWRRKPNLTSPNVRTDEGVFIKIGGLRVGASLAMSCPPLDPNTNVVLRLVTSSSITSIMQI